MSIQINASLVQAVAALRAQQVIAYPTEAVFGLGCDPDSESAVQGLLQLKQRSWEKGLILIAADYEQLTPYVDDAALSDARRTAVFSRWPGPVTWVFPARESTPRWLTGKFSTLAVRVSDHPLVRRLCLEFGKPVVSTSANLSGLPPCRNASEVKAQFGASFPLVEGDVGGRENPSEIRDAITGQLIRQG